MYRSWVALVTAGLLGGLGVVSLFVGFESPPFLVAAAVSAVGAGLAYNYARERMLRSVYADVGARPGPATDDRNGREDAGEAGAQATDGGSADARYDRWTWADADPDDPFWSDDPEDWEDPWEWERVDPEDAGTDWRGRSRDRSRKRDRERHESGSDRERHPDATSVETAYETLGLEPGVDAEAVRAAYRERAKETHPDRGGDPEAFIRVREAYERLREHLDQGE